MTTLTSNEAMLVDITKGYDMKLLVNDRGLWTIYETTVRPIAKVASESAGHDLIKKLQQADRVRTT